MAVQRPAVAAISFAQSRLWFIDRLEGPSPIYNMAMALRLDGELDVEVLGAALADVVGRHESLRTVFPSVDGVAGQVVVCAEQANFGWEVVDARGWSETQLRAAIEEAARYSFDLAAEIPLRARLFALAEHVHVLVTVVHHIAADGWSATVVVGDLGVAYVSRCGGRAPGWAPLPVQYVDYTLWQRDNLGDLADEASAIAAQLAFWEDALAGLPERVVLPTDRPYPLVADHRGAGVAVDWPGRLQEQVRRVAREHNATSFMVIQAALAVLLSKISANHDVAVGIPVAGRSDPALDELVGMFVNTLVLRVQVGRDGTFAELLDQVRARSLAAFEHQDAPFEVLVDRLNPVRSLTHHPLVQVMLAWQNFAGHTLDPAAVLRLGDVQVSPLPVDTRVARMDLVFSLAERYTDTGEFGGIAGAVEFRTDVFDAASIQTLIERLQRVLEAMTADPERRLSWIDVLTEAEHAGLDQWGNRGVLTRPGPPAVSIPALFGAQVARTPDAVALSCGERSWTYRELDEATNRLAHLLAGQGVGPGAYVALLVERSAQAIIAVLAVLKTGAAYVPVDPHYPDARIGFVFADAAPVAVISTAGLGARLGGKGVVVIDVDDPVIDTYPCTGLSGAAGDDIAYLIYTSGTTGVPKGVAITHHNITELLKSLDDSLAVGPQVWTQCHSLAFDFSVWEIFGALLRGGRLVVVPETVTTSPSDLHALLVAEQVSVLSQTPSAFYALQTADALHPELADQLNLQTVVFGGEALEPQRLGGWLGNHPAAPRLINMYGITETTVHASFREIVTADTTSNVSPDRCAAGPSWLFCFGWVVAAGAGRGGGGVVCGGFGGGVWVLGSVVVDGVAVCGVSVRGARGADVSQRGCGVLGRRRPAGVSGARR